tara:strand:- start:17952 stop:18761 length:810 start_codon:yes stop_codon:yes gene_type:complete
MKVNIVDLEKKKVGEIKLPKQFNEKIRPDIISRAVLVIQGNKRQPYGANTRAGKRHSADLSRRRKKYRGSYGLGISRVPRKIMTRRGTRFNWVGAVAPGTVGGRRAHPPKGDKSFEKKINKKERLTAIKSAISATMISDLVKERGHKIPEEFPFIVDDTFEKLDKTKGVIGALEKIGFKEELERAKVKKVRAGKGKNRGRKYKKKKAMLIVTKGNSKISKSARNVPGIEIVDVKNINAELLAPGTKAGRLTLWTKGAIESLEKDKLFLK